MTMTIADKCVERMRQTAHLTQGVLVLSEATPDRCVRSRTWHNTKMDGSTLVMEFAFSRVFWNINNLLSRVNVGDSRLSAILGFLGIIFIFCLTGPAC